jgi:hypothetical protein
VTDATRWRTVAAIAHNQKWILLVDRFSTLAFDLALKTLPWEDGGGEICVSYIPLNCRSIVEESVW